MKAYRMVVCWIDYDELGSDALLGLLNDVRLPNHIIGPRVMSTEEADIGEWHDGHPLNSSRTMELEFDRLFPEHKD